MDRFISDLHFNHTNILKYDNRPFKDIEEMNSVMIENWNSVVDKEDTTYILGDFGFGDTQSLIKILNSLNGKKILIKGNHDSKALKDYNFKKCFIEIYDYKELQRDNKIITLCHYPILAYNGAYRNGVMLYGHVHNSKDWEQIEACIKLMNDNKIPCNAINVGASMTYINYTPRTLDELLNK